MGIYKAIGAAAATLILVSGVASAKTVSPTPAPSADTHTQKSAVLKPATTTPQKHNR